MLGTYLQLQGGMKLLGSSTLLLFPWFYKAQYAPNFQERERGLLLSPSNFKTGRHLKILGKLGPLQAQSHFKMG